MALNGILAPIDFTGELNLDLSAFARKTFVNDAPLVARLPRVRGKAESFTIIGYNPRGRSYVVGTGDITNVATSLPLADASALMVGDILRIRTSGVDEDVEITADPVTSTTPDTVTVRRARGGTSAAAHTAGDVVTLVGNSRTGAEIDQTAQRAARTTNTQNHQRFEFPVQVGGRTMDIENVELPAGESVLSMERESKLVEMIRDMEYTSYYGRGEAVAAHGDRGKQKGIRQLVDSANLTTSPTNAGAYTPNDLLADVFQKAFNGGGNPNMVFCSTGFMGGLFRWGYAKQQIQTRTNSIGMPIEGLEIPFFGRTVTFVPCLQLGSPTNHTAFAIDASEVMLSWLRQETWQPRGIRGDAMEGDWLADIAIKMVNPTHHAWVENVTAFA